MRSRSPAASFVRPPRVGSHRAEGAQTMEHGGKALQFERLLFFSDAVFAIAITLLVIEIRLPHFTGNDDAAVGNALLGLIPNYIGFLVSFLVVGRFWVGHHSQFGFIDSIDRTIVWRNLLFLGAIAFMPFPTAVLVEHTGSPVAVIFYGCWLILAGLFNKLLFARVAVVAKAEHGSIGPDQLAQVRGTWMPVIIGSVASGAALVYPAAGMLTLLLSPLIMRLFQYLARPRAKAEDQNG